MPTTAESATLAVVTSGLGVGIIAGVVSGVCYVIFQGFGLGATGRRRPHRQGRNGTGSTRRNRRVRKGVGDSLEEDISEVDADDGCASCVVGKRPPRLLMGGVVKRASHFEMSAAPVSAHHDADAPTDFDSDDKVKNFIERLVEAMVGYSLDDVSVRKVYRDASYLPIIGQSPCSAHASLKLLLGKIVQEAIGLPKLSKVKDVPVQDEDEEHSDGSYQDLLSTAILNKVIQNYREELSRSASRNDSEIHSSVDRFEGSSREDEWYDGTCANSHAKMSLISSSDSDNWSLRRRSAESTPVPMLVPQPNVPVDVLIGDVKAEDISDLSDTISEYEETTSNVLVASKTIIGGKNYLEFHSEKNIAEENRTNDAPLIGSYTVKEREKWNNAVEINNNPYSAENLRQRLKGSNRGQSRDYYIRQASFASGERNTFLDANNLWTSMDNLSRTKNLKHAQVLQILSVAEKTNYNESEIVELKERKIVSYRLGQFSKSTSDLEETHIHEPTTTVSGVSVEKLKTKFDRETERHDYKCEQVYSLTARSIPREFRQELKSPKKATDVPLYNQESPQLDQHYLQSREFPNTKIKIRYFEELVR